MRAGVRSGFLMLPRWLRRSAVVAGLAVVALVATTTVVYGYPGDQQPRHADVIEVLGPPQPWRVEWARELLTSGYASALIISVHEPQWTPLCDDHPGLDVTCFTPQPFTTRGEARYLRAFMAARGYHTALAITITPHVGRSRFILGRCVATGVQVVGRTQTLYPWSWPYQWGYQTAGWLRAIAQTGC